MDTFSTPSPPLLRQPSLGLGPFESYHFIQLDYPGGSVTLDWCPLVAYGLFELGVVVFNKVGEATLTRLVLSQLCVCRSFLMRLWRWECLIVSTAYPVCFCQSVGKSGGSGEAGLGLDSDSISH